MAKARRIAKLQAELRRVRKQINQLRADEARLIRKIKQLQGAATR